MEESFAKFLDWLLNSLKTGTGFGKVLMFILLICISLFALEYITGVNFYNSLQKKTAILKELTEIAEKDNKSYPELTQMRSQITLELSQREIKPLTIPSIIVPNRILIYKILSGSFIGLFFLAYSLLFMKKIKEDRAKIIKGSLAVAVIFGFIGAVLPIIEHPYINYIGLPLFEALILTAFGRKPAQQT